MADRVTAMQRELATYDIARSRDSFLNLWKESQKALKELWDLREEMARHAATHTQGLESHGLQAGDSQATHA